MSVLARNEDDRGGKTLDIEDRENIRENKEQIASPNQEWIEYAVAESV